MWARILDGVVAEIISFDPAGKFHHSLVWAQCGDEIRPGWIYAGGLFTPPPGPSLEAIKDDKRDEIRNAFAVSQELPVSAIGHAWNGGFESALKIDGVRRMAETAGLTEVTLWDSSNAAHALNMADATMVALLVGQDYQVKFAQKQGYMNAIDAATTVEQVVAIVWE